MTLGERWREVFGDQAGDAAEAEALARAIVERGQKAHPNVRVDDAAFVDHVAERHAKARHVSAEELHVEDLYLACAWMRGDPGALATFDKEYAPSLVAVLRRLRLEESAQQDVLQRVREQLFLGREGDAGKIAQYAGTGPLLTWLRAVTGREGLLWMRKHKAAPADNDRLEQAIGAENPELDGIRAQYIDTFKSCFADALATLSGRDRNVLRLTHVEGLPAERIAKVYGVHRVTIARWIADARAALLERTRAGLEERLGLSSTEFESASRLCLSQLDITLERALGGGSGGGSSRPT